MTLNERMKRKGIKIPSPVPERKAPLWKGPEEDGITFSLLNKFLACRERFRLLVVEGLQAADVFNHRIEYGNMWHAAEEGLASGAGWLAGLTACAKDMRSRYPLQQGEVSKWYEVCKAQFPIYLDYWGKKKDKRKRTPVMQEEKFSVPYLLPSGRRVLLRGKWDRVDIVEEKKRRWTELQENKTKGDIKEAQLRRQLKFDAQTMIYVVAFTTSAEGELVRNLDMDYLPPIKGVLYNVIRRPLSGGKGTIVQKGPSKANPRGETEKEYYARLAKYIKDEPETYFMRWDIPVTDKDVEKFRGQCLDPILEQLCDWWGWVSGCHARGRGPFDYDPHHGYGACHFRAPYGTYSTLNEGIEGDLDEHLDTGSEVGLARTDNLFPELT